MNEKITLSSNDARKLYWDVLSSNLLFIVLAILVMVQTPWLWLQIVIGIFVLSTFFHIIQAKKVLVKGKLLKFPKKSKGH